MFSINNLFNLDFTFLKIQIGGISLLGIWGATQWTPALVVGVISSTLAAIYWALKIWKEFIHPFNTTRKNQDEKVVRKRHEDGHA